MSRQARAESSTPARNTRARSQTPLPGLVTKQSHAYGAQGKTNLHTQIRASGGGGGSTFAEEFSAAQSPAKKVSSRPRVSRPQHLPPPLGDGDDAEEAALEATDVVADSSRVKTALGRGMGYVAPDTAGDSAGIVPAVPEPSVWRKFREWSFAFGTTCIIFLPLICWMPLPIWLDRLRFDYFWLVGSVIGLPGYAGPAAWAMENWHMTMAFNMTEEHLVLLRNYTVPQIQWSINANMLSRLIRAETQQKELESTLGLHNDTLEYIKSILPVTVVLEETEERRYTIPQEFWQALSQRIAEGGDEVAPLWDSFISNNEKQMLELSFNAASSIIDDAAEKGQLVTKDAFAAALEQQNLDLAKRYTQDYQRMWEENFQTARDIARETTEQTMEKYTSNSLVKQQLEVLRNAVDLQNAFEALRSYNWFNLGEGAVVDPRLTSATAQISAPSRISAFWNRHGPLSIPPNPPRTALEPWTEVTDCWCAAPSPDGSAQISVMMNEAMHPERLIIEHIPAGGTRNIANAPRTIEIWADAGTLEEARRLSEVMEETIPYPSPQDCTKRPSESHICLGRGEYDIHHYNHVQSLPIWTHAVSIGLAVNSFTIRIVNNWGGQRTCLYRLRMIGDSTEEVEEGVTVEQ